MADPILKPVSSLAPAATLTGAELVPVVQGGANKRATAQAIANLAAAAAGGFPWPPKPVLGNWVLPSAAVSAALSQSTFGADTVAYTPMPVGAAMTVTELAVNVTTAVAGAGVIGIYNSDAAGAPTDLLGSVSISTSSVGLKSGVVSVALVPGMYWLAYNQDSTASLRTIPATAGHVVSVVPGAAPITLLRSAVSITGLPNPAAAISAANSSATLFPAIYVRRT